MKAECPNNEKRRVNIINLPNFLPFTDITFVDLCQFERFSMRVHTEKKFRILSRLLPNSLSISSESSLVCFRILSR
jgi:hypothetical protein